MHVSPDEAASLQGHFMFERQRRLRERNLRTILTGMHGGKYLNNNIIWICHQKDIDRFIIINGQHTLECIVQYCQGFSLPVVIDPVANEAEIEARYSLFDMGAARTETDILHMMDIVLDVREENDLAPRYASPLEIRRSTEAITWLSTGLASNVSPWSKFERANAVRADWSDEIATFLRVLGEKRDPDLAPNEMAIWGQFHRTVMGGTLQAPFLASLRAYPEETVRVLSDLVEFAKGGGELDQDDARDPRSIAIKNLYEAIVADNTEKRYFGSRRNILVWRVALFLNHARRDSPDAIREEKKLTKQRGYSATMHSWELATDNRIDKPEYETVDVDMAGARERRVERLNPRQRPGA
jgi:hypothetical protein